MKWIITRILIYRQDRRESPLKVSFQDSDSLGFSCKLENGFDFFFASWNIIIRIILFVWKEIILSSNLLGQQFRLFHLNSSSQLVLGISIFKIEYLVCSFWHSFFQNLYLFSFFFFLFNLHIYHQYIIHIKTRLLIWCLYLDWGSRHA